MGQAVNRVRGAVAVLAVVGLSACGGSSSPSSPGTPAPTPTPPPNREILADPSFSTTIQEIFERNSCATSSCHGSSRSANLDLRAGTSYGELVDVQATLESFLLVAPGDPEDSYLVIKLEGRQAVGSRMPLVGAALDEIDLTNIRNWIAQGAKNN